jgi:predicted amidohydrolase
LLFTLVFACGGLASGSNATDENRVVPPTFGRGKVMIGGVQFAGLVNQKDRNMAKAEELIREAAKQGAQIVMTPEVVITGFVGGEAERKMAEPIPGPATERFARLAKELGVYILFGMSEMRDDQIMNAMPVLSPKGELMGVMRKVHINKYETGGGWRNGSEFPVWEFATPTGRFRGGIMICYDREMPESARILMLKGVDVIFNPLACTCPTDDIHRCLLRTRAFENEVYLFMVNHAAPRQNGHSMFFDYKGNIVHELDDKEGIFVQELDFDALNEHRKKGIYGFHHRRPELYQILTDPAGQTHPPNANLPK